MKARISWFLASGILVLMSAQGCKKELVRFNLEHTTRTELPAATNVSQFISVTTGTEVRNSETFRNEGTSADKVKNVNLKGLELKLINPENEDFGFMTQVRVFISYEDGSGEQEIAWKENIPESVGKLLVLSTNETLDLDGYIKADKFRLTIKYKQREVQWSDLEVDIIQKYRVTADPL